TGITFATNGKRFGTSSFDKTVKVYDGRSAKEIVSFAVDDLVSAVTFSPDGEHVAAACGIPASRRHDPFVEQMHRTDDFSVQTWDISTQRPLRTYKGHKKAAVSVAFNADGSRIASGGEDGRVLIWDTNSAFLEQDLPNPGGSALAFHPTKPILAAT